MPLLTSNCICRVKCGEQNGTAFMINSKYALTVFHVVKDFETNEIHLFFNNIKGFIKATFIDCGQKYKKLDIALLELENEIELSQPVEIVDREFAINDKWQSRGFPASKIRTGENLISVQNCVNQVLNPLHKGKIDLQLEFNAKFSTYGGLSGAPLIMDDKIVGIINTELSENGISIELNALSVKHFKELLQSQGIEVKRFENTTDSSPDLSAIQLWDDISLTDFRNIKEKLEAVTSQINKFRLIKYSRDVASGKAELIGYNERDVSSMKFRIFDACQDDLISFVEKTHNQELSYEEVDALIEQYTLTAETVLKERSKDYFYPLSNRDTLKKIVLGLIEDCYLSFDEEGIYAQE